MFGLILVAFCFACKQQQPSAKTGEQPVTTAAPAPVAAAATFACPMHPEITGKEGDKCSKCNMDLKPVASNDAVVYACPMHPEITGKPGDKCSKCKMDLKPVKKN